MKRKKGKKMRLDLADLKVETFETLPQQGAGGTVFGYGEVYPSCGTVCQECQTNDTQGGGECGLWYTCNNTCNNCTTDGGNQCTDPATCLCY